MNRQTGVMLLRELATACTAVALLFGVACAIRLAFDIPFGQLGPIGLGFGVLAVVARVAARRFAPKRRRPPTTLAFNDADRQAVAALHQSLRDFERVVR